MLFTFLDKIRTKPKHVRDQYALGIAVFCTLVIGGVWSLSLPTRFGVESQVAALASSTNAAPFANFFTQLKNQFSGIKKAIDELPKATTTPTTSASSTQAALDLQLSPENKDQIRANETTGQGTKIQFGTGASATTSTSEYSKSIMVGTSSNPVTPAR